MATDYNYVTSFINVASASGSPAPYPPAIPTIFYTNLLGTNLPSGSALLIRSLNINFYITYDSGKPDWTGSVPYWAAFGTSTNITTIPSFLYSSAMGAFTSFNTILTPDRKETYSGTVRLVDADAPICINNPGTGNATSLVVQFVPGSTSEIPTPYFSEVGISLEGVLFQSTDNFNIQNASVTFGGDTVSTILTESGTLKRNLLSVYVVNFQNTGGSANPTASFLTSTTSPIVPDSPVLIGNQVAPLINLGTGIYVDKKNPWILRQGAGLTIWPRALIGSTAYAHATYITES